MTVGLQSAGVWDLVEVVQALSLARDVPTIQDIVRRAARRLTGADGATFVLRDDGMCFYADEDAIAPLWKGQRFPLEACISGWAMLNGQAAVIPDIYADPRIPHDAYRPTFVKSLAMVPIRRSDPIGAIGNYWAHPHEPTEEEVELLSALADSTAIALEHVAVLRDLEDRVAQRTEELTRRTAEAELLAERLQIEVARRQQAQEEVRRLSVTDPLTGVLNRRGFLEQAEAARRSAQRLHRRGQLLFVDLDGLKAVNDDFGHDEGDRLIARAAKLLQHTLDDGDVVGRWGGDELVVYLPALEDPRPVVERLHRAARDHNQRRVARALMSFSIGSTPVHPTDHRALEQLLVAADSAMYANKLSNRPAARLQTPLGA